jgi:hypothetical protein
LWRQQIEVLVSGRSDEIAANPVLSATQPGLLLPVYTATIFLSAALLFSVQPLFAKIVLPSLGGAPAVWSVALVFFQGALLAGYLYAHFLTRFLPGRASVCVHLVVMLAATLALPLGVASGWGRPPANGTELWLIALFTASIGVPFFALAANAPLLQAWFARTGHASSPDPYFLYAASNVGSFVALLSYPFLVEPLARLSEQTFVWSALFVLLIVMIGACGFLLLRSSNALPAIADARDDRQGAPGIRDALIWITLGAVPSAFLVAVTAHISTDIAAVPLLWVLPLALYLLTFVIVFQTRPILPHRLFVSIQPAMIALLIAVLIVQELRNIVLVVAINLAVFFVTAMVCHGELARRRPAARHLTAFYLWLATGGVIGGIFAGLIAPNIFNWVVEYPILIVAGVLCRPGALSPRTARGWLPVIAMCAALVAAVILIRVFNIWPERQTFAGLTVVGLVLAALLLARNKLRLASAFASLLVLIYVYLAEGENVRTERSFFGVHKIYESDVGAGVVRVLLHGTTIHGAQMIRGKHARTEDGRPATITYFGTQSPMAKAFAGVKKNKAGPVKVAVVGLGAGTVACYLDKEDELTFYEIDETVIRIARNPQNFEFISKCKPDSKMVTGDARLTLADAPDGEYDLIVMDAFTSDAVPVHLLTREAMALYLEKLAPGGLIVSHVMNRHLELPSVVAGLAAANGLVTRVMHSGNYDSERYLFASSLAAVAREDEDFGVLLDSGDWVEQKVDPEQRVWTDDYSNILGAMLRQMRD